MLETLHEFALEQLTPDEEEALRRRHVAYYVGLAERAAPALRGPREGEWLDVLERGPGNLRAALDWCAHRGQVEQGLRLGAVLWRFWWIHGHLTEGRARLACFLDLAGSAGSDRSGQPELPPRSPVFAEAEANALYGAGLLAKFQGDFAAARAPYTAALVRWRAMGDMEGVGHALMTLGTAAYQMGDADAACRLEQKALETLRRAGDQTGVAWAAIHLGAALGVLGDAVGGRQALEDGLAGVTAAGERMGVAWGLRLLSHIDCDQGDYAAARCRLIEALAVSRELGDRRHQAQVLESLAEVAAAEGQPERAIRLAGAAGALRRILDAPLAPLDQQRLGRWIERARASLADGGQAAWEAGHTAPLEHVLAEAAVAPQTREQPGPHA
jgi:tetratricopeptide (TPR) repeat protein